MFSNPKETLVSDLSAAVQGGSKFAIVSEGSLGKTHILNTIISRRTAYHVAGKLKKQIGRGNPVYTSQKDDVLFEDLTLSSNISYYAGIGSIHPRLAKQMVTSFGLTSR